MKKFFYIIISFVSISLLATANENLETTAFSYTKANKTYQQKHHYKNNRVSPKTAKAKTKRNTKTETKQKRKRTNRKPVHQ